LSKGWFSIQIQITCASVEGGADDRPHGDANEGRSVVVVVDDDDEDEDEVPALVADRWADPPLEHAPRSRTAAAARARIAGGRVTAPVCA
jgi:hypothetical protein